MSKDIDDLGQLLELAVRVARLGGSASLHLFGTDVQIETKRETEHSCRRPIAKPNGSCEMPWPHAVLSTGFWEKNSAKQSATTPFRWILDPIDGTISFVRGSPLDGVIVGLQHENDMVAGVIHMPVLAETVAAARGKGCFWNDHRCHVSSTAAMEDALIVVTDDQAMRRARLGYRLLAERAALVRTWGDCYGPVLVATGRADILIDNGLDITDIGALEPIIEEAGGTLTDWIGCEQSPGRASWSPTAVLHGEVLEASPWMTQHLTSAGATLERFLARELPEKFPAIRPERADDVHQVSRWLEAGRAEGAFQPGPPPDAHEIGRYRGGIVAAGWKYCCWIIQDASAPVGYVDARVKGRNAELLGIDLNESARGRRVGRHVVRWTIAALREQGCRRIRIEIYADNRACLECLRA